VSVVGNFNGWNPTAAPMQRIDGGDAWVRDVVLESGRHVYAFVVDGAIHVDPSAPRAAEDDFGVPSSAIVVPAGLQ
jgi:1,4-alpha-glucan branching enzyme